MNKRPIILLVDDQAGEIRWLIDRLEDLGCDVVLATNERDARAELGKVRAEPDSYVAGIFDIMVATVDLETLLEMGDDVDLDKDVLEPAIDTGIRLIDYARLDLDLDERVFPIAALSARDDSELEPILESRGVPLFRRDVEGTSPQSIMRFIERFVRPRDVETG